MINKRDQLIDTLNLAMARALADTHTITIARVTAVGASTISCRPVIDRVVDGVAVHLPEFAQVPVVTLQGGGSYTAYPIATGDYCLLLFTERCFDRWYAGQDYQPPLAARMHDYSDGFALVGVNPLASAIEIPGVIQQNGDTDFVGDHTHLGDLSRTGDTNVTGDLVLHGDITVTGDLVVDGDITCTGVISAAGFSGLGGGPATSDGDFVADGVSLKSHTHPVSTAPGTTGAPS